MKPGGALYEEILLPTREISTGLISRVELRPQNELKEAKDNERLSMALDGPMAARGFEYSHHFRTPPMYVTPVMDKTSVKIICL